MHPAERGDWLPSPTSGGEGAAIDVQIKIFRRGIPLWVPAAAGRHEALPLRLENLFPDIYSSGRDGGATLANLQLISRRSLSYQTPIIPGSVIDENTRLD